MMRKSMVPLLMTLVCLTLSTRAFHTFNLAFPRPGCSALQKSPARPLRLSAAKLCSLRSSNSYDGPAGSEKTAVSSSVIDLLHLCAATNRGTAATLDQRYAIENAISTLESENPTQQPAYSELIYGEWNLVYSSEAITRSSPFFWSFRKLTKGIDQPLPLLPSELSEAFFAITDGLPFYTVGRASQQISAPQNASATSTLVSQVQVTLRLFDALLPPLDGLVTTTSDVTPTGPSTLSVTVSTTEVRQSTLATLPVLGAALEGASFPTRRVLEDLRANSSTTAMELTYLDDRLRIVRNDNGQTFVYVRAVKDEPW